ncbi:single-stranded DNA-binding protein [Mesomycoplasma neurolyticum]|uniref:Single-stranded DNA-binding protein n=1 Tax=Mesomycoplasma neurolyticum TaxID=2120 RepID=A0A449A5U5_9BACT|nr:single-stranded DNA-binding protein [Mesomycoplasma neurolyticum]VEU59597.1 single strand binding protein [Mesomycoplasma neurolyticum]
MNKVFLAGRIANDFKLMTSANNNYYTWITLAVRRNYKSNEGNEITDFIPFVAWNKTAEILNKYAVKGVKIFLEANLNVVEEVIKNKKTFSFMLQAKAIELLETKEQIENRKNKNNLNTTYCDWTTNEELIEKIEDPIEETNSEPKKEETNKSSIEHLFGTKYPKDINENTYKTFNYDVDEIFKNNK